MERCLECPQAKRCRLPAETGLHPDNMTALIPGLRSLRTPCAGSQQPKIPGYKRIIMENADRYRRATFAAGCFWDAEAAFRRIGGVVATAVGYTGGTIPDPTYELVSSGTTGHAEAVEIIYDPDTVTFDLLLGAFWEMHDPAQDGGQGDYTGSQYRSAIYCHDDTQKDAALASRSRLALSETFQNRPVVTEILPATTFWLAEESHQQFYEKCGQSYCTCRQADD
jgi:methionine-S-sulfoxide reductase